MSSVPRQTANHVLMVQPSKFRLNEDTAKDNHFHHEQDLDPEVNIRQRSLEEYLTVRNALQEAGVRVTEFVDIAENNTPDSIFPNNWFSTHRDSQFCVYPLLCESRRRERRSDIIDWLQEHYSTFIDFRDSENQQQYLEGTGSLVLDRQAGKAYACTSGRTSKDLVEKWCATMGYTPVIFEAADQAGIPIYHTNILMSLGTHFGIVCTEVISEKRDEILRSVEKSGKEVIEISRDQMYGFAGNILELSSEAGEPLIVLSSNAYQILSEEQRNQLSKYGSLLHQDISTIEAVGGGGIRCMLAELF